MLMKKILTAPLLALAFTLGFGGAALAQQAPKTLDDLLEQTRKADLRDNAANREREARFASARDQQAALLREAQNEKAGLEARAASLAKQFEDNDRLLGELQQARDIKAGNLGELFGVLRQAAGDFATAARNSMLTVQIPERIPELDRLAQTKSMPPMEDLQRFWFELQREMTEGGKVTRFNGTVVAPDGSKSEQAILRIGQSGLSQPDKQPPGKFSSVASKFERQTDDQYHPMVLDPTRGSLLSLFSLRPSFMDRIIHGEAVVFVIIAVGLLGMILGCYQFVYLTMVGAKVRRQLENLQQPNSDNPLGRVLATFKGGRMPQGEDAEVVELRITETVLRELPPIQRYQPFLKLAVAAGPLLGLVGTVIGMIVTFQAITESGSGDPKIMADGIGQAMMATVMGLGIAIPLLFLNSLLQARSKKIVQVLDEQSTGMLAEIIEAKASA
jgi:biopolymer transport protein ExbB